MNTLFDEQTRARATQSIQAVEALTCAEVVISARHLSGRYREADWLAGALTGLTALVAILFLPQSFEVMTIPLDVLIAFAVGALISSRSPRLRRWLTPSKARAEAVRAQARAAFVDLGVSRTSGRHGVLIFVSQLEGLAVVLPDIGVPVAALGEPWRQAVLAIEAAAAKADPDALLSAITALGPCLSEALPRTEDDVNELSDEVMHP